VRAGRTKHRENRPMIDVRSHNVQEGLMRIKVISGFLYPGPGSTYEKGNHGENGDYTVYVLWEMRG